MFERTNTLIVLDDCDASNDVKKETGELVKLGFSARHYRISVWVVTRTLSSIAEAYRDNVAAVVLFYAPSAESVIEEYAGTLSSEERKKMVAKLKERPFAHLVFSLRYPFEIKMLPDPDSANTNEHA